LVIVADLNYLESATRNIGCRFVVVDFLATDLSVADFAATKIPLLTSNNGFSVVKMSDGKSIVGFVNQQRIIRC